MTKRDNLISCGCMLQGIGAIRPALKSLPEEILAAEWRSVNEIKIAAEEPVVSFISLMFGEQLAQLLEVLPEVLRNAGYTKSNAYLDPFMVHQLLPDKWNEWIENGLADLLKKIAEAGYRTGALRVEFDVPSYTTTASSLDVMREVISKTKGINNTSRDEIEAIVLRGLEDDSSIDEIAGKLSETFSDWQSWRAQMVAQTTATPTFEIAQLDAYRDAGIAFHAWLTQRDGKVRKSHTEQDGDTVAIGQPFKNGLRYAGDVEGPAKEVIRCRCTTRPNDPKPEKKSLLLMGGETIDTSFMNDRERDRVSISIRDMKIRTSYPELRESIGQSSALASLASTYSTSEATIKRAIWG